ncbi:MAG: NAD(P)(+) transhydrogenase (Re/Si-specific) subunit beta, partial [Deefgea sp.]
MTNLTGFLYLVAAVLFILSLRGLSSPKTALRGNLYGMIGMVIAVLTTFFVANSPVVWLIVASMAAGALVGAYKARTVAMTAMPELVAAMHSLVGLAAVLIAVAAVFHTGMSHTGAQQIELFLGAFIGAITFTASVVAYGKLSGKFGARAINFKGQ